MIITGRAASFTREASGTKCVRGSVGPTARLGQKSFPCLASNTAPSAVQTVAQSLYQLGNFITIPLSFNINLRLYFGAPYACVAET